MKTAILLVASMLALTGAAAAATAATATTAAPSCDGGILKDTTDCAIWAVRCIGDALGGHHCTQLEAAAANGPVEFAKCMATGVLRTLKGQPSPFCYLPAEAAASAGPKDSVQCVYTQVRGILDGTTPMPCVIEPLAADSAAGPDPKAVVECAKYAARGIVGGHPQPCPVL